MLLSWFESRLPFQQRPCSPTAEAAVSNTVRCRFESCQGYHLRCTFARLYVCTFARLYICTFVRLYVCTFARLYVCTFVHLHVCTLYRLNAES